MHSRTLIAAAAALVSLSLGASPALATGVRTWVSDKGTDSGACSLATPCRTFAYALTQTTSGGEIVALASAGYGGGFTITQAVSIVAPPGIEVAVSAAAGQNAITVAAGATDKVVLRGLAINGTGVGANGVVFNSGGNLTILNCLVLNFAGNDNQHGNGILIQHSSGSPAIFISNTTVVNNTYIGVSYIPTGSGGGRIDADHLVASNNLIGFAVYGGNTGPALDGSLTNSVTDHNSYLGVQVAGRSGNGYGSRMVLSYDQSFGNKDNDIYATGFAVVLMSNCSADTFQYGQSSLIYTYGNNSITSSSSTGGTLSHTAQF